MVFEIGLRSEYAVTLLAVIVIAGFVRFECMRSREELLTVKTNIVFALAMFEEIINVVEKNVAKLAIIMIAALDVVLSEPFI